MSELPALTLRLADLATRKPTPVLITPDAGARAAVAASLGITAIRKLRFEGTLKPQGRTDWQLTARLGATVVQDCVVTLDPVTTRIDEDVARQYIADLPGIDAAEVEMTGDDTTEPLPAAVNVAEVMIEALALALPAFPRAPGVDAADIQVAAPGVAPLTDDDVKPFAGLGALRDKLAGKNDT